MFHMVKANPILLKRGRILRKDQYRCAVDLVCIGNNDYCSAG
jgi:hypothetical protein